MIFTKKHVFGSFSDKVTGLQGYNFIKKRLQYIFSCKYQEMYKGTYSKEHLQPAASAFLERPFFRSELSKGNFWWWKVVQISQDWTKVFPIINYLVSRKKIKFLYKKETTAIRKSSIENRMKSKKYFSPQKIWTLNICDGTK